MFINPVNTADISSSIKSTGFYNAYRISDRFDADSRAMFIDKVSNQPNFTPDAPISKSKESFKNLFERAKQSNETDDADSVSRKKDGSGKEKSSNTRLVNAKGNGFILTIPEEHLKKLDEYKSDLQHQVYELFNSSPDAYRGALVDVVA